MTFFSGQACDPKLSCFLLERKKICILSCEPLLWALWVKSSINEVARRSGCLSSKSMISLSVKLPKVSPGVREDHVRLTESRPAWVLIFPDERNRQGVPTDEQERASQRGTSLFIPSLFDFFGNRKTRKRLSTNLIHPYPIVNAKSHYFRFLGMTVFWYRIPKASKALYFFLKTKQPLQNGKVLKPSLLDGFKSCDWQVWWTSKGIHPPAHPAFAKRG